MKAKVVLPIVLMLVFAASRMPGLMPLNFSAAYALMFCAGAFFPKKLVWWLPFATLFVTDILLNVCYYHVSALGPEMIGNYLGYAALLFLGRWFSGKASWLTLVGGSLLGAVIFYLVSNTMSWLVNPYHNPEYTRNFAGWIIALTRGTAGWPSTWEFFRNTLSSTGLFSALFAGAMKALEAFEPAEAKDEEEEESPAQEPVAEAPREEPKEAKA